MIRKHPILWSLVLLVICLAVALSAPFSIWKLAPEVEYTSLGRVQVGRQAFREIAAQGVMDPLSSLNDYLTSPAMLERAWKRYQAVHADDITEGPDKERPKIYCKPHEVPGILNVFSRGRDGRTPTRYLNALLDELVMTLQESGGPDSSGQVMTENLNLKVRLAGQLAEVDKKLDAEKLEAAPSKARLSSLASERYQIEQEQRNVEDLLFKAGARALSGQITVKERASKSYRFDRPSIPPPSVIIIHAAAGVLVAGLIIGLAVLYFELWGGINRSQP